eukprot:763061-Hanusia_phi.AAC.2
MLARWGMRWRDGRQERFTRLNLRADRNGGYIRGTGQDCIGESLIEGRFDPSRDRIAWTQVSFDATPSVTAGDCCMKLGPLQMYQLRRGIIHMEIWGEFGREVCRRCSKGPMNSHAGWGSAGGPRQLSKHRFLRSKRILRAPSGAVR